MTQLSLPLFRERWRVLASHPPAVAALDHRTWLMTPATPQDYGV